MRSRRERDFFLFLFFFCSIDNRRVLMSEAEQDDTGAVIAAEQAETATVSEAGPADESTRTGTVTEPSLAKEIKKQATPKQLEALRLARVAKQEKAVARKLEYEKLAGKISIEQTTDSDSETEYVIKRVKRSKKKVAASPPPKPVEPAPTMDTRDDDNTSEGDDSPRGSSKKKRTTSKRSAPPEFTLNFV